MNDTRKYINGIVNIGRKKVATNRPTQYNDLQPQIYKTYNEDFAEEYSEFSSDYVWAEIQKLDGTNNYKKIKCRLSDVRKSLLPTGAANDDYKVLMIPKRQYQFIPTGAKVKTMGNVWLVTNPTNMTGTYAETVIVRCNASYNVYDYYGNVISEPLYIQSQLMYDNESKDKYNQKLQAGYFNVYCQKNEITSKLGENKRIILGERAYHITGFCDFIQEFTFDRASADMITFTIRVEDTKETDDLINYIADGKTETFNIQINGDDTLAVGDSLKFDYRFIKNGEEIQPTTEYPLNFYVKSSNENVINITNDTTINATGTGNAILTLYLSENKTLLDSIAVEVKESINEPEIAILSLIPLSLEQFNSVDMNFAYFENGEETDEMLSYRFSGAGKKNYNASVSEDTKTLTIECISPSRNKLHIEISAKNGSVTREIEISLVGY